MAHEKELLTQAQVNAALAAGDRVTLKDGGNLFVEVFGPGRGTWKFIGRLHDGTGKLKKITLGNAAFVTVKQARKARMLAIADLARGIDRNAEQRAAREQKARITFHDVAQQWFDYWKGGVAPKTAEGARGRLNNHILPKIGTRPFEDLTRSDYAAIVTSLPGDTPKSTAYKAASLISEIEKFAVDMLGHPGNRADGLARLLNGQPHVVDHHPAITTVPELKDALIAIEHFFKGGNSGPHIRSAVKLIPLTCLRASKMAGLEWDFLDLDDAMLHLPAGYDKNRLPLDLPLAGQTVEIFRELAAFRTESPYCFPSGAAKAGHVTVQGLERAIKKIIDKDVIMLHGWRTTFLTFAQEHGWPRKLCDELISHKQGSAVTLAYDRAQYLPQKRALVQWHADFLDAVRMGGEIPAMPEGIVGRFQY